MRPSRFTVELLKPAAVLIENVPAVVHDRGRVVARSLATLGNLGYSVSTAIVEIGSLGLAQRRKRHVLVGVKHGDFDVAAVFAAAKTPAATLGDYLAGLEDEPEAERGIFHTASRMTKANLERVAHLFENDLYDLPDRLRPPCHRDRDHSYVSMYGRLRWDKPAQTITSGFGSMGQGRFVHPTRPRTLTPHEAARIQGLPDFFRFHAVEKRTVLQETIGNAVPPRLSGKCVDEMLEACDLL